MLFNYTWLKSRKKVKKTVINSYKTNKKYWIKWTCDEKNREHCKTYKTCIKSKVTVKSNYNFVGIIIEK